jgi:ribosome modulation factor
MQNPYNEGLMRADVAGATVDDCPYSSSLMMRERQQWLRGFCSAPGQTSTTADVNLDATRRGSS